MIVKWMHLGDMGGDQWVKPIWTAIINARKDGKQLKKDIKIKPISLHISTRLNMLPRIIKRINAESRLLFDSIKGHDPKYTFTSTKKGYAFTVDDELKYNLLLDIDSLLFEINACSELILKFLGSVYDLIGTALKKDKIGKKLKQIIRDEGEDESWFVMLDNHRNFFSHDGTPYIAVDVTNESDGLYDVLVLKENIHDFGDQDKYFRLSDLNKIVYGFGRSKKILQNHIINLMRS
jgi:hypothetical protein